MNHEWSLLFRPNWYLVYNSEPFRRLVQGETALVFGDGVKNGMNERCLLTVRCGCVGLALTFQFAMRFRRCVKGRLRLSAALPKVPCGRSRTCMSSG